MATPHHAALVLPPGEKPLLRGVFHEIAVAFALAGAVVLTRLAIGPRATFAAVVYGVALTLLFSTSALYHRPRWGPRLYRLMRRLDHAAIFVLIAGTYTPICLLLPARAGLVLLAAVWTGALAGVVFAILWPGAPKWLNATVYVGLGWAVVPVLPALARALGPTGLWLLMIGGVVYSLGAVIYALRRPNPFPRVFGYHEIFHLLVIVAAAFQYAAVVGVVEVLR
jgi:hemolysin III